MGTLMCSACISKPKCSISVQEEDDQKCQEIASLRAELEDARTTLESASKVIEHLQHSRCVINAKFKAHYAELWRQMVYLLALPRC